MHEHHSQVAVDRLTARNAGHARHVSFEQTAAIAQYVIGGRRHVVYPAVIACVAVGQRQVAVKQIEHDEYHYHDVRRGNQLFPIEVFYHANVSVGRL